MPALERRMSAAAPPQGAQPPGGERRGATLGGAPSSKPRPVYLDLFRIRMPMPSVVSFLHRVTGALMLVFGIPLLLAGVEASLASPEGYADLRATLSHPLAKLVLLGFAWAFFHHLAAGIRHLLLDLHVGVDLDPARRSSVVVFVVSIALTLAVGAKLW